MNTNLPLKIAVTGASGFIGRHVLTDLLKRGADIVAVTRRYPVDRFQ